MAGEGDMAFTFPGGLIDHRTFERTVNGRSGFSASALLRNWDSRDQRLINIFSRIEPVDRSR